MPRIFITYRRESGWALAGRLYDKLSDKLGQENIFIDIDDIDAEIERLGRVLFKIEVIDCFDSAGAAVTTLFAEPEKAPFPDIYVNHPSWQGFVDLLWEDETLPVRRAFCAEHSARSILKMCSYFVRML